MEPIAVAARRPLDRLRPAGRPQPPPPARAPRHRDFPLAIIGSSLLGVLVIAGGRRPPADREPGGPARRARATEPISLTGVRPVAHGCRCQGRVTRHPGVVSRAGPSVVDIEVELGTRRRPGARRDRGERRPARRRPSSTNAYVLNPSGRHGDPADAARSRVRARRLHGDHHLPGRTPRIHRRSQSAERRVRVSARRAGPASCQARCRR